MSGKQKLGAVGIIHNPEDATLVLVSQRKTDNMQYQFCGGHVDFGEDPVATLRREVLEEVGEEFHLAEVDDFPKVVSLMLKGDHIITLNYECLAASVYIPPNPEPDLCTDWEWMSLEDLSAKPLFASSRELFSMEYFG